MQYSLVINLTKHAIKRFKERTNIKAQESMLKRAKQAYDNGVFFGEFKADKIVSFNGIDYVFKTSSEGNEYLITLYKTQKDNVFVRS